MSTHPRRDTRPELRLRSLLHRRGLRFRVHRRVVPGAPRREIDIVFGPAQVAVSVLGCYWHGCPDHTRLAYGETREWWRRKLAANRERDRDTRERLARAGWLLVEVWECEDAARAADRIATLVVARR